jgi:biotin-dependent carboxylase-like uncharacterized protein
MSLKIIQPGTQTMIMDAGRPGHRHQGIPGGGAADRLSFAIANHLVGNRWDTPALECALGGLHVRFERDAVIAVSGAQMWSQNQGMNLLLNKAVPVEAGDILTMSFTRAGCRAYLAIAGGFDVPTFMESVSTYMPAALGGLDGGSLKTGDILPLGEPQGAPNTLPVGHIPTLSNHVVLRASAGPEWEALSDAGKRYLFTTPFYATAATDRMGTRLKGDQITLDIPVKMTSSPLLPGSLQVPPDGQPILALADGHCTGGYARALQIIQADLWLLGQIAPGAAVSFRRCFKDDASVILHAKNSFYAGLIPGFTF